MEKNKRTIVSKLMLAALLLAINSGGIAWGQVLQKQQNPPMQLRGGIAGGIDANASGNTCCTDYTVRTSFTVENNYGPGESGTLTPKTGAPNGSQYTGRWNTTDQIFNMGSGRITLGGTTNHVGHSTTGANHNSNLSGRGTSTGPVTASQNLYINPGCDDNQDWTGSAFSPHADGQLVSTPPLIQISGTTASFSRSWGPATISISTPTVPDGTGVVKGNGNPTYTAETRIVVDGSSMTPETPWWLQQFYFEPNPWYFYNTAFTYPTYNHTVSFTYTTRIGTCQTHGTPPNTYTTTNWGAVTNATANGTGNHLGVQWNTSTGNQGGFVDARLVVQAGSDIRLEGGDTPDKSITASAANGGSKKFYLDLPATSYTLMNDKDVAFTNIEVANRAPLGVDAVFGVKTQIDTDIATHANGGTILIGAATNPASQGHMTITASTTNSNTNPYGFSGGNGQVYTGTCIPANGTANLGNYGVNDITVDGAMKLPIAMASGKLQIYNTKENILFKNKLPATGATGHVLIMAAKNLTMDATSTHTMDIVSSGNTTLMGSNVILNKDEMIDVNSTGNYNVIAHADYIDGNGVRHRGGAPALGLSWNSLCTGTYPLCNTKPAEKIITAWPSNAAPSNSYTGGQPYEGDCDDLNFLLSNDPDPNKRGGSINFKEATNSTVKVENVGMARWQAQGGITTGNSKTITWTVGSTASGTAQWLAGGSINLGSTNTVNWSSTTTNAGDRIFWNASGDINTNNVTANWTTTDGNMYWRAGNTINAGRQGTSPIALTSVDWSSTAKGDMRWEAKNIRVMNGTTPLKFTQTGTTGKTAWNALQTIDVAIGDGVEFTNSSTDGGTMLWWAGEDIITKGAGKKVAFVQTTDAAGLNAWKAGQDIKTKNLIEFENGDPGNKSNMEWYACRDILTNHDATAADAADEFVVKFTNKAEGNMIWHAGRNIDTRSQTLFKSDANKGNVTWFAGGDIHTRLGKSSPQSTLGEGVLFTQLGSGRTVWKAGGSIETHNTVHFDWTAATEDTTSIYLVAGKHITIGGVNDTEYDVNNPEVNQFKIETSKNNPIGMHSIDEYIRTNSLVNIDRTNTGVAETYLWAGCNTYTLDNNIDIENVFNYTETGDQAAGSIVKWYAENDILSNTVCDNNRPAPITFTVPAGSKTKTLWEAERNINTKGRVDFKYGAATDMGPLTWLSRGGYIQTERPVTIAYLSDSTISFRAEKDRHDDMRGGVANANTGGRRGNIHFFDSIDIKRSNPAGGLTEIKAENHIWTAMLNYVDKASTGDTMDIISHKGDIYLGYNDGKTSNFDWKHYVANSDNWKITQKSPSADCAFPAASPVSYDKNRFTYTIPASNQDGHLWIKAGWEEKTDFNTVTDDGSRAAGGNIYWTHLVVNQATGSNHPTEITIPYSGLWRCGAPGDSSFRNRAGDAMRYYENAGIIAGVSRCLVPYPSASNTTAHDTSLIYRGGKGDLTVDAGKRGNIIVNKGAYLNFQDPQNTGNVTFRTRFGDIDMRDPFNADSITGSLLFLAQLENFSDLAKIGFCGCEEERNNVYLQDFQYKSHAAGGSVFVGADNNIKLNYGGLQNKGTRYDPFLSTDYKVCSDGKIAKIGSGYMKGGGCGNKFHCDMDTSENQARDLILNFEKDEAGTPITSGGFAAVASDYIDVYKNLIYTGGAGSGMSTVPGTGTLHGEGVSGYGLYMKTQGNKKNWDTNIFLDIPKCPTSCSGFECNGGYLHMVSRMTFHADARIYAHAQKVYLGSPVIESFGPLILNSDTLSGGNTGIVLQADSLIMHDSLVLKGTKTVLRSWSGLKNDRPVMKFGYMRRTPPFTEYKVDDCNTKVECAPCHYYIRGSKDPEHMLDTITIKYEKGASLERLNSTVFDHTVLTFLTDSFDHKLGDPILNAKIYVDTLKVRNQVDLFADKHHTRDANFELISEEQMHSKDYAGVYMRHYHMEPIGPCGRNYSELWLAHDPALDVITYSTFGGFGLQHSDVHVETMANLNPGFTSLRLRGQCYEQRCGTLTMRDLRLDGGAQLHFSVGTTQGINGEYSDAISVEKLTTYGRVDVNIEIRPCEKMEARCYPLIYYKSQTENSLNNLNLVTKKLNIDGVDVPLALDFTTTPGVVYLCVGNIVPPSVSRSITIPSVAGVTTTPSAGITYTPTGSNFSFKAKYSSKPLVVRTNRIFNGVPEVLSGVKNANGEYEYNIIQVRQDIVLTIGPDEVANTSIDGTAVWSHGETIYIRVEREDIASIYSVAGQLVKRIELPEGDTPIPMQRGVYVVTLKDGSVHKVIVK